MTDTRDEELDARLEQEQARERVRDLERECPLCEEDWSDWSPPEKWQHFWWECEGGDALK